MLAKRTVSLGGMGRTAADRKRGRNKLPATVVAARAPVPMWMKSRRVTEFLDMRFASTELVYCCAVRIMPQDRKEQIDFLSGNLRKGQQQVKGGDELVSIQRLCWVRKKGGKKLKGP
jgi:hypothetical protein